MSWAMWGLVALAIVAVWWVVAIGLPKWLWIERTQSSDEHEGGL